jgi:hypothetical protein
MNRHFPFQAATSCLSKRTAKATVLILSLRPAFKWAPSCYARVWTVAAVSAAGCEIQVHKQMRRSIGVGGFASRNASARLFLYLCRGSVIAVFRCRTDLAAGESEPTHASCNLQGTRRIPRNCRRTIAAAMLRAPAICRRSPPGCAVISAAERFRPSHHTLGRNALRHYLFSLPRIFCRIFLFAAALPL